MKTMVEISDALLEKTKKITARENVTVRNRIVAVALILFAATAAAEHQADHRYDVRGYVLSADKRPLDAVPVTIGRDGQVIGGGRTDGEGYYAIQLHLHDSDIDGTFAVRAGEHQALIRMQAEYGNRTTARVHHVNFVGGEVIEKNLSGIGIPAWVYIAAAPLVLWAAVRLGDVIRRKVRTLRSAHAPEEPGREKKRGRKSKR